jgi:hypothetical protein
MPHMTISFSEKFHNVIAMSSQYRASVIALLDTIKAFC